MALWNSGSGPGFWSVVARGGAPLSAEPQHLQCTPVVVSEDRSHSTSTCLQASPLPLVLPTLCLSGAMTPQPWGLLSARSSGTVSQMSWPSYREDSLVHRGARGATALYTSQLCDNRQELLVQQIKNKAEMTRVASGSQTFDNFRQKVCSSLVLLHPVALHDLTITVDANIPAAARLRLTVEHGGVRNVVVLEHTLFELTLRSEVLL